MQKQIRKRTEGFTIIEVLIVLAIAGLILLIVFLAVPALQRNSRNTNRKNDVAALLGAATEYAQNNNGKSINQKGGTAPDIQLCNSGSACTSSEGVTAKVGFYGVTGITVSAPASPSTLAAVTDTSKVTLAVGFKCDAAGTGATAGGSRSIAALYAVESGGGNYISVCQEG